MWKLLFIIFIFVGTAAVELPGIIKRKQWKELAVYSVILICGFVITLLHQIFNVDFTGISH